MPSLPAYTCHAKAVLDDPPVICSVALPGCTKHGSSKYSVRYGDSLAVGVCSSVLQSLKTYIDTQDSRHPTTLPFYSFATLSWQTTHVVLRTCELVEGVVEFFTMLSLFCYTNTVYTSNVFEHIVFPQIAGRQQSAPQVHHTSLR